MWGLKEGEPVDTSGIEDLGAEGLGLSSDQLASRIKLIALCRMVQPGTDPGNDRTLCARLAVTAKYENARLRAGMPQRGTLEVRPGLPVSGNP